MDLYDNSWIRHQLLCKIISVNPQPFNYISQFVSHYKTQNLVWKSVINIQRYESRHLYAISITNVSLTFVSTLVGYETQCRWFVTVIDQSTDNEGTKDSLTRWMDGRTNEWNRGVTTNTRPTASFIYIHARTLTQLQISTIMHATHKHRIYKLTNDQSTTAEVGSRLIASLFYTKWHN